MGVRAGNGASAAASIPNATDCDLPSSNDATAQAASQAASSAHQAAFGSPEEEVMRLTHSMNINYYSVLKVEPDNLGPLKRNYFKLSRLVHPDKCQHPEAGKAMAVVSTAYDVLSTPMKKKLYDAYATQEKPEDMSYAQWEAQQVQIPAWLEKVLKIPGGGCCLIIVLIPLLLILAILSLVRASSSQPHGSALLVAIVTMLTIGWLHYAAVLLQASYIEAHQSVHRAGKTIVDRAPHSLDALFQTPTVHVAESCVP